MTDTERFLKSISDSLKSIDKSLKDMVPEKKLDNHDGPLKRSYAEMYFSKSPKPERSNDAD